MMVVSDAVTTTILATFNHYYQQYQHDQKQYQQLRYNSVKLN